MEKERKGKQNVNGLLLLVLCVCVYVTKMERRSRVERNGMESHNLCLCMRTEGRKEVNELDGAGDAKKKVR